MLIFSLRANLEFPFEIRKQFSHTPRVKGRAKKNILLVSCNGLKKKWVGRSVKKISFIIFLVKNVCFMHVLC